MWMKWLPWRFIVRNAARQKGFLDPIALMSRLQRFSQPSEIAAPTELLRFGAILHARGLMNSQAIQHNLDWIWPFWVERQFNPLDEAFVPRAFSITHINLTHRNWTAVGLPDTEQWPIIDPRGLGYLRRPDGSLVPYGHDIAAEAPSRSQSPSPFGKPGGGSGDTTPPR